MRCRHPGYYPEYRFGYVNNKQITVIFDKPHDQFVDRICHYFFFNSDPKSNRRNRKYGNMVTAVVFMIYGIIQCENVLDSVLQINTFRLYGNETQ